MLPWPRNSCLEVHWGSGMKRRATRCDPPKAHACCKSCHGRSNLHFFKFSTMSTPARRRLMRDFRRLQGDPPSGVTGFVIRFVYQQKTESKCTNACFFVRLFLSSAPREDDIMEWNAVIFGYVFFIFYVWSLFIVRRSLKMLWIFTFQSGRHTLGRWHLQAQARLHRGLPEQAAKSAICHQDVSPQCLR